MTTKQAQLTVVFVVWLVGLLLIWAPHVYGQQSQAIYCDQQASAPAGFTTKVTVVAAPSISTRILVCGWVLSMQAGGTITFQYGTGGDCATNNSPANWGPTVLPSPNNVNTFVDSSSIWRGMATAPGNDLCVTATNASNATVYYTTR